LKPWRIDIAFDGGGRHETPDVRGDFGWGDMAPGKRIRGLAMGLPTGHCLRLSGFEAYNVFAEASQALTGGRTRLEAVWICGRRGGLVDMWRVGDGQVVHQHGVWGREWGGGATRGWLAGTPGGNPTSGLAEA